MTSNSSATARIALRNTVWLTMFSYVGQFISFAANLVLTRLLGPQVFGLFSIGTFWSSQLDLRAKSGLSFAAIRQPATDGELLGTVLVLDLVLAVCSLALGFIAAIMLPHLGYTAGIGVVVIMLLIAGNMSALVGPIGMVLEKELQLSRLSLVYVFSTVGAYGIGIVLAYAQAGIWSLLVTNLVTSAVSVLGMYWVCRQRLPHVFRLTWRFNMPLAKLLLKQGIPIGLSSIGLTAIVNQFDNFLIGTFVSTTTLGYYDRAYRMSQWPNVLLTAALVRVGFLTFAKVQNDLPRLVHTMRLCLWVLTTLGIPIALTLCLGAPEMVAILYGPSWSQSAFFLRFLAIYSLVSPSISLGSSLSYALGNMRMTVLITAAQVVAIIAFATPLTLAFGSTGTVLGVGITIALGFALSSRYIFRRLPLSPIDAFGRPVIAIGIASFVTLLVFRLPGWNSLPPLTRLIATASSSAGVYIITLFALRPSEMIERVVYLTQTFRGRQPLT